MINKCTSKKRIRTGQDENSFYESGTKQMAMPLRCEQKVCIQKEEH